MGDFSRLTFLLLATLALLILFNAVKIPDIEKYRFLSPEASPNTPMEKKSVQKSSLSAQDEYDSIQMAPFEESNRTCSVGYRSQMDDDASRRNKSCTWNFFDRYFQETGQFYGDGYWDQTEREYVPEHCFFSNRLQKRQEFETCLSRTNISRILITGDSTGRLLTLEILAFLESQEGRD